MYFIGTTKDLKLWKPMKGRSFSRSGRDDMSRMAFVALPFRAACRAEAQRYFIDRHAAICYK